MSFKDKSVLIIGVGFGIGKVVVLVFVEVGVKIVVLDINEDGGRGIVEEIKCVGGIVFFKKCNVVNYWVVVELVDEMVF